jgi:hypothetical protein
MSTETGARATGTRECTFCHHFYINPCDEQRKARCSNWLHLTAATTKPKVERVKLNPQPKAKKKAKHK